MPRPLAPSSASVVAADGAVSIVNAKEPVWFALVAGAAAGSALFHDDDAGGDGDEDQIARLNAPAGETTPLFGPFFTTCGLSIAGIDSASVMVWRRNG